MKKVVLVAALFIAFATDAQQRRDFRDDFKGKKVEYRQDKKDFYGLRLSQSQERKIAALSKQRLSPQAYDAKLRKILTKDQYKKYASNSYKYGKYNGLAYRNQARR